MPKTVIVDRGAASDLARIARFIGETVSPASATKWSAGVDAVIRALADDAEVWPEADESATLGRDLRMRLSGKRRHVYRILFTIEGEIVRVQRVRHAAQTALTTDDF